MHTTPHAHRATWAALCATLLAACSGGGGSSDSADTLTVNGDVPLVYVKRATSLGLNPTDGTNSARRFQ